MINHCQQQAQDLIIIGHLAFNEDHTSVGTRVSNGGSAYYCAMGASILSAEKVGIVATVGLDFDVNAVVALGINVGEGWR